MTRVKGPNGMGFGYRKAASDAYDRMMAVLREGQDEPMTNTWTGLNGRRYFTEMARKDQPDGGLRGEVLQFIGATSVKRAGYFNVAGDGTIKRWPGATKAQMAKASAPPAIKMPPQFKAARCRLLI